MSGSGNIACCCGTPGRLAFYNNNGIDIYAVERTYGTDVHLYPTCGVNYSVVAGLPQNKLMVNFTDAGSACQERDGAAQCKIAGSGTAARRFRLYVRAYWLPGDGILPPSWGPHKYGKVKVTITGYPTMCSNRFRTDYINVLEQWPFEYILDQQGNALMYNETVAACLKPAAPTVGSRVYNFNTTNPTDTSRLVSVMWDFNIGGDNEHGAYQRYRFSTSWQILMEAFDTPPP